MKIKRATLISLAFFVFVLCLCLMCIVVYAYQIDRRYKVVKVIDGDTLEIRNWRRAYTVRMLGINTPETVDPRKPPECYGKEASTETKKHLKPGARVFLEFDVGREKRDKYERYLAYVSDESGLSINLHLIKAGFAREYTYGKEYSRKKEFERAEKGAKKARLGLWSACM